MNNAREKMVELSDEMLEEVVGGSIWDKWVNTIYDMCDWVNEQFGEEIYRKHPRKH